MMMLDPMMILAGDYLAKDAGSFQGCLESAEAAAEAACDTWNNEHERERERDIRDLEDVCKMRDLKLLQICFASKMLPFREGMNSSLALLKLFCCHVSYDRASAISARCRSLGEKQGCFPPKIRCFACTLKTAVILNPPQTWCQRAASQMPP